MRLYVTGKEDNMKVKEIKYYKNTDPEYPQILNRYERMPEGLYVLGTLPDPKKRAVAIVGSRSCSEYGRNAAREFAEVLGENGVQIISGMALGIDSAAHEGALMGGGETFAVLGSGVDVCYPESKKNLYESIIETGGILSEYEPGAPALAYHFPMRNRIISGLCDAVIVIEARIKSGSLITANYAIEQNKTIYALPGRVGDRLSAGTNDLIGQGAIPALSPEQILSDLGIDRRKKEEKPENLPLEEAAVLERIGMDPVGLDQLLVICNMGIGPLTAVLTRLTLKGLVREAAPGIYVRNKTK